MDVFLILVGIIALAGIITIIIQHYDKKRTEALKAVASSLNFSFSGKESNSFTISLDQFLLFSKGHDKMVSNVMKGRVRDIDITIMGYKYTIGVNQTNSTTWAQTVILFQSSLLRLPSFDLQPESFIHKIGSAFGYEDINFDSHPVFSEQYLLRSTDERAVRNIFTNRLLAYYDEHKGLSTEGDGDILVFYRRGKKVPPQNIRSFLDEGFSIFNLVRF